MHDPGLRRDRTEESRQGIFVNEATICGIQLPRITSNGFGVRRERGVGDAGVVSHVVEHRDQSAALVVPVLHPYVSAIDRQDEVSERGVVAPVGHLSLGRRAGRQEEK